MADDTKNVFVSHVHEDDAGLGKLKDLLKANGMTIRDYSISSDNPNNAKCPSGHFVSRTNRLGAVAS